MFYTIIQRKILLEFGSDYNMELVIALEMSRLQMIEDRMKQAQAITPDPSSSISNNSNESTDDQLKLAIQLSLQESSKQLQQEEEITASTAVKRSSADIAVDCFLKSLVNHNIDVKSLEVDFGKDYFFKPCNSNEDGRFQISDIHEKGFAFVDVDDFDDDGDELRLKRSHSTGDLCVRRSGRGTRVRINGDEPRYHLDSDHSSQHDDKPEDVAKRILMVPSTKQFVLLQQSYPIESKYMHIYIF